MSLTAKQKSFVNHYITTLNGVEAARLAGYKGTYASLCVIAHENLRKLKIRQEIDRRLRSAAISADETLARVSKQATSSMGDFLEVTPNGDVFLDFATAAEAGKLDLIKKYKETETTRISKDGTEFVTKRREIELYAADSALDKLMRYHGLYNDKVAHTWQAEIIQLLREGEITADELRQDLGDELATELFERANISR